MITLLKPGINEIMELFYKEKRGSFHLREISRRSGLHIPSTKRCLDQLEDEGVLRSEMDGNLKKYSIIPSSSAFQLFGAFDIRKIGTLPELRQNAIRTYLDSLPVRPVFAVLFGSTAKGTFRDDSDIDILIVTHDEIDAGQAEKEADALTAMHVSTFQLTYRSFIRELKMKEDSVVQSAIFSGIPLMDHLGYYRMVYDERG